MSAEESRNPPARGEQYGRPQFRIYGNLADVTSAVGNKGAKDGQPPPPGNTKRTSAK